LRPASFHLGVVRRHPVDETIDPLFETLRRYGWGPMPLTVQGLNIMARDEGLTAAIVDWPDEQPDWLKGVCDRMTIVTLHASMGPAEAAASAAIGSAACFAVTADPAIWVPSLASWIALQSQRLALQRREREQRGTLADARAISAAVGLLAERNKVTIDQAFATLRNTARGQRKRLEIAANDILDAHKEAIGQPPA
jgi:hypothetical protein